MKILMLNHNVAFSGGTFFRAYHFARMMAVRGHQVTLVSIAPTERLRLSQQFTNGFRLVQTPDLLWGRGRTGWDLWDTFRRTLFVGKETWDIVHAFDSRPAVILPAVIARRGGVPLVVDWADWWGRGGTNAERSGRVLNKMIAPLETFFEEAFRTSADQNTVISTALHQRALGLGVRPGQLTLLPQGSDTEQIRPIDRDQAREVLGIPPGAPLIGHLGVLQPKDGDLLAAAVRLVRRQVPGCKLVLIGRNRFPMPLAPGERDTVVETGGIPLDRMVNYLAACDVLLLPLADSLANRARWPSRVNDYLAAGRPVALTSVGDVGDFARKHGFGVVAPPNAEDFAGSVVSLIRDPQLRADCGARARAVAENELAWPVVAATLDGVYSRLSQKAV